MVVFVVKSQMVKRFLKTCCCFSCCDRKTHGCWII